MSKYLEAAKKRAAKAAVALASATPSEASVAPTLAVDSQETIPGSPPQERFGLQRKNAMKRGSGSEVDLTTPSPSTQPVGQEGSSEKQPKRLRRMDTEKANAIGTQEDDATVAKEPRSHRAAKKPKGSNHQQAQPSADTSTAPKNNSGKGKEVPTAAKSKPAPKAAKATPAPKKQKDKTRKHKSTEADHSSKNPGIKGNAPAPNTERPAPSANVEPAALLSRASTKEIEDKESKRKAYKARKQRFYNSLTSSRTPDVLRKKASESRGCPEEMQKLYEEWLQSNEKWQSSSYVIQLQQPTEHVKFGANRWMTFQQLSDKYGSSDIAQNIVDEKRANPQLAKSQIKRHPDCPKRDDMVLYLCWDSESETHKEATLLTSSMATRDEDSSDDALPSRKHKKRPKDTSSSDSDDSDNESSQESKSKSKKGGKAKKKGKDAKNPKKRSGKKSGKNKKEPKTLTEEEKRKKEEKEQMRLKKKAEAEQRRKAEKESKKLYQEKVSESRKTMNQLTSKIADVRSKMEKAKTLSPALAKAIRCQLDAQRADLQHARDALQIVIDNFEETKAKQATKAGEDALLAYQGVLNAMKM